MVVLHLPDSCSNWNLEMLVFEERGKPKYQEKNLSEHGRELTTKSHWWGVTALTTASPLLPAKTMFV